jgi:iron complex outermembrane receptor protein
VFNLSQIYQTLALLLLATTSLYSQTITGFVLSSEDAEPIIGARIRIEGTRSGAVANRDGFFTITGLAAGSHTLSITAFGYAALDTTVEVGRGDSLFVVLALEPEEHEEEEIVITGTRTQRSIDDVPVRVEAVPQEEVEEKLMMSPANVSMLLNESTGMRVQTTSPTTSSANLRIQGLPGRYTQLLTDGIPNVGGLSAGLGLTELPPLNLRQVEIIKGAASALYGADAISGVVNFITKDPRPEPEVSALVNYTSQKGLDIAAYGGGVIGRHVGLTLMASRNTQPRFDVDDDGFADVPEYERHAIYPKIVIELDDDMKLDLALGFISDERLGGAMSGTRSGSGSSAPYLESISSKRFSGSAQWSWEMRPDRTLSVKLAGLGMTRDALYGTAPFNARQEFLYAESQYTAIIDAHTFLVAAIARIDDFEELTPGVADDRSYRYNSPAFFMQDEFPISEELTAVAGARLDFGNRFGTFLTPRLSLMYKPSPTVTMRIGGGTGFKVPTIFVEEAEERGFQNVRLATDAVAEQSRSGTFDINWRGIVSEEIGVSINAAAYLTALDHALVADADSLSGGALLLRNASGALTSKGAEISTKLNYEEFKLSLGYTYLDATQSDREASYEHALNPRHSLGVVLFWESEESGAKVGLEGYYTGRQRLDDHPTRDYSPGYWIVGLLAEKAFGPVRLFINFENFTDTRQTRFEPIIIGNPADGPVRTLPVYAPLEGRVINGGVRFVL